MQTIYRLISTPAFEKDVKVLTKRDKELYQHLTGILNSLRNDPYNINKQYDIKKLAGVEKGEGQWRIRTGNYRLRYDIYEKEVVLHSFRHRKEAY
jgi:addiction module RelE/StbE family toxin